MVKSLFLVVIIVSSALAVDLHLRTKCRLNSECGANECCYYHEGPLIMSRRDAQLLSPISISNMHQGGYCETYHAPGGSCSVFEQVNGHCGCAPNYSCQFEHADTLAPGPAVDVFPAGSILRRSYCETYHAPGGSCSVFEQMNGHCGCAPNYSCQFEHADTLAPGPAVDVLPAGSILRRGMVYQGPGSYKCLPHK